MSTAETDPTLRELIGLENEIRRASVEASRAYFAAGPYGTDHSTIMAGRMSGLDIALGIARRRRMEYQEHLERIRKQ